MSLGVGAIFNKAQGKDLFGRKDDFANPFSKKAKGMRSWDKVPSGASIPKWELAGYSSAEEAFLSGDPVFGKKGFATGGLSSRDNVPAMLMGGEYVVNKNTVNRYGKNFFDQLNSGRVRGYADGGMVGGAGGTGSSTIGDTNIAITVNVEGNGNAVTTDVSENEERRSGGDKGKQLANTIKVAVLNELTEQKRPGGILYGN